MSILNTPFLQIGVGTHALNIISTLWEFDLYANCLRARVYIEEEREYRTCSIPQ